MPPLLALERVDAGYNGIPVFSNLTLRIEAGTFAAIVGPTGAGKTTLLKILLGALVPLKGRVMLKGEPLGGANRAQVGYVPQRAATDAYFPITVEQVILMGLRGRRLPPWPIPVERRAAATLAERLGILGVLRHHICDVSGGQQQRAFLARALISSPSMLVLDEPTAGVDMRTQQGILKLLDELNREGITILMTTHDLNAVAVHLPDVLCFNHGLVARGSPAAVFTDRVLAATFGENLKTFNHDGRLLVAHVAPLRA
ncbi:MAG: metal ABC transporter ATP-binding protein [Acetobacteraceae bacterium]|nr:metal ABC transporter ATP-binding protein [Acetobacteraceae bacterium]